MEKILEVQGMTCEHCKAKVEKALEGIEGVEEVKVSLFKKQAKVKGENLEDEKLVKAVEEAGYKAKIK
ncbi:copper chaperone CopZ [Peptoniphilus koenoeneniae]|uniref:Copper chaperone CopZ n=1 Tax=Peptoniphilus koenoeneniae TaxID=507751 RepID=A0ABU0AV61_9FIRM|nr:MULTISPECIES: heavy metal-associated domain-containing protein [Peptoniphilus]ERT57362.1 putative copper chaperone CopZ [Peptoniphilus sp. BV3C26]MDQ0275123.1 copper chaperone CopZ [Peptoniphilus koenoeneniae]